MSRDFNLQGSSRRDFIRGVFASAAALGVGPLRALEALDHVGGAALADEACLGTARMLNLVAGTGGFAWFTLLWPVHGVMVGAPGNAAMAGVVGGGATATVIAHQGDNTLPQNHPLYARKVDGQPLFGRFGRAENVTCVVAGHAMAHEVAPAITNNTNTISDGVGGEVSAFAAAAALQRDLPVLMPVIGVRFNGFNMPYRPTQKPAPEAPPQASVLRTNTAGAGAAEGMVGLFTSAAAQLAERLGPGPSGRNNAALFAQYYRAFQSLTPGATRPTYQSTYRNARQALTVLSKNLGPQLDFNKAADNATPLTLDQIIGSTAAGMAASGNNSARMLAELARSLVVAYKAFRDGLTAQINLPVFNDDPHPAFAQGFAAPIADGLARAMNWFMEQMANTKDPLCPGRTLADSLVITMHGDLPKNPYSSVDDWSDAPPAAVNWIYIVHGGELKPGWFGHALPGGKRHVDPATGQLSTDKQEQGQLERPMNNAALAAVLYAVTKGNKARVRELYTGNYDFLVKNP